LDADAYFIFCDAPVKNAALRLIRSNIACQYVGAVKEYLATDPSVTTKVLTDVTTRSYLSAEAYQQQITQQKKALEAILATNSDDAHALFHLAKIGLGKSDHQVAFDLFRRFVALPEQIDEEWRWYAYFSLARLAETLEHEPQSVINAYLLAYQSRPVRAEASYELARLYRQQGNYALAYIYSSQAYRTPLPVNDTYDLNTTTYNWHIPAEHALISQQLGKHDEVIEASNQALVNGKVAQNMRDSLVNSRQRSVDLVQQQTVKQHGVNKNRRAPVQNHIRLLIPYRNAAQYLKQCIKTIESQDYDHFTATFIDDCSSDGSADLIPVDNPKFELIRNTNRIGALRNRKDFILGCDTDDIVLYLDGDDQLASDNVLSYVNQLYQENDCWLTYGQYISQNGHMGHALPYASHNHLMLAVDRGEMRFPIHPITHRAGLFQRITDFDPELRCFKDDHGEWLFYASDAVLARPMFCLAGFARIHYCNRALYLYTEGHDSSVYMTNNKEQIEACRIITTRLR